MYGSFRRSEAYQPISRLAALLSYPVMKATETYRCLRHLYCRCHPAEWGTGKAISPTGLNGRSWTCYITEEKRTQTSVALPMSYVQMYSGVQQPLCYRLGRGEIKLPFIHSKEHLCLLYIPLGVSKKWKWCDVPTSVCELSQVRKSEQIQERRSFPEKNAMMIH